MTHHLIIGSNRGIGLELVRQLAEREDQVTAVCRKSSPELDAIEKIRVVEGIDTQKPETLDRLVALTEPDSVTSLWVVAGILRPTSWQNLDFTAIRDQFEINAMGPLRCVEKLQDRVRDGGKIGILTSRMGSIEDNTSGGSYGYRMSKAALNAAGKSLAIDLEPRQISVALLHPGWVQTEMTGGSGQLTTEDSARGLIERMDEQDASQSGRFVHQNGETLPW